MINKIIVSVVFLCGVAVIPVCWYIYKSATQKPIEIELEENDNGQSGS